jgi:tetratricopeptide (TPR) repeat protein
MIRIVFKIALIYIFIIYSTHLPQFSLYGQDTCSEILTQAEQNYFEGRFDDTISLVKSCLSNGRLDQSELVRAYKILAQAYLAKNYPEAAGKIISKILEINPNYSPTIENEPPPYGRA